MRNFYLIAMVFSLFITSCAKTPEVKPEVKNNLPGGAGGPYNLAFFSRLNGAGVNSRMYIKYGADKMPADTAMYDNKMNTMIEPGYGPHTHFDGLTTGTYYVLAKSATAQADTIIVLTESSKKKQDIYLNLK